MKVSKRVSKTSGGSDMGYQYLLTELKDSIFTITLNRPEVRNAFNWDMHLDLNYALMDAHEDEGVRVVVLTGAGNKAFSGGLDLKEGMNRWGTPRDDRKFISIPELLFKHYTKPVIAAINGFAIGWGLTLTLLCDIRIAAESAKMSMRFTQVGLIPEAGSPLILPQIVGLANALELGLTAKTIDAREAFRIGLVNKVVPDDQLMPAALEMAGMITEKSSLAIAFARRGFYDALSQSFDEQQRQEHASFAKCAAGRAFSDQRQKFADKKKKA
jgi:enoyl-CoA hydratase/carnithine racemase